MLDHPDDDRSMLSDEEINLSLVDSTACTTKRTIEEQSNGLQGAKVALLGDVNAGKSSLFNLLGSERAIA